jgi:stress response protein YsnF
VLDRPVEVRHEGNTTIIPIYEEVLVVEKGLMLKEEIRITKRTTETHQPQQVITRSEEVIVEHEDQENRAGLREHERG